MLSLATSPQSILRRAQQLIAARESANQAPVVLWSRPEESSAAYAARTTRLRERWSGPVLAVVPAAFTTPEGVTAVELPPKLHALLNPATPSRYRCASGGRGSAKSHSFATAVVLLTLTRRVRVLCCREIMRSLRESVHHLLCDKIDALKLTRFFEITDRSITCTATGSEIIFSGLWAHISTLKSLENISLVWIEESESVSARSLETLTPTVRAPDSEIWLSLNPDAPDAPVMQFVEGARPDTRHEHVTFRDNPWFASTALEAERAYLERVDHGGDTYAHVWEGKVRRVSDALIFRNRFVVEEFEPQPDWSVYHGCDFGFSSDPAAAVRCYVADRVLYISHEFWGLRVELDALSQEIERAIPGSRNAKLYCDCSLPGNISYLQRHGHAYAEGAEKYSGSVQDGITYLRSFEKIVIHPRCQHTIDEFRSYSFKTDKLTNLPTTEPEDRFNHVVDALRYSLVDLIRTTNAGAGLLDYYAQQLAAAKPAPAADAPAQPARHAQLAVIATRAGGVVRDL